MSGRHSGKYWGESGSLGNTYAAGGVDRAEVDEKDLLDNVVERGALVASLVEQPLKQVALNWR